MPETRVSFLIEAKDAASRVADAIRQRFTDLKRTVDDVLRTKAAGNGGLGETLRDVERGADKAAGATARAGRAFRDAETAARQQAGLRGHVQLLAEAVKLEGTRAQALGRLSTLERALDGALKDGNLAMAQRVRLEQTLVAVRTARAEGLALAAAAAPVAPAAPRTLLGLTIPPAAAQSVAAFATRAEAAFDRVVSAGRRVRDALFSVQTAVVALGAVALVRWLADANREYQRLTTQLKAFTGDQRIANAVFRELQRFAVELPFDLKDITSAYIELNSLGIQPTEDGLRRLSDLSSAMSVNIAEVAHSVRRLLAGEADPIESLLAGSTFRIHGDEIVATFDGVTKTIRKDARDVMQYIDDIAGRFAGASADRMKTLDGALSNLSDSMFGLAVAIGNAGVTEEFTAMAQGMAAVSNGAQENQRRLRVWTVTTIEGIRTVANTFAMAGRGIAGVFLTLLGVVTTPIGLIGAGISGLLELVLGFIHWVGIAINKVSEWNNRLADSALGRAMGVERAPLLDMRQFEDAEKQVHDFTTRAGDMIAGVWSMAGDQFKKFDEGAQRLVREGNESNRRIAAAQTEPLAGVADTRARLVDDPNDPIRKEIEHLRANVAAGKDKEASLTRLKEIQQQITDQLKQQTLAGVAENQQIAERVRLYRLMKEAQSAQRAAGPGGTEKQGKDPVQERIEQLTELAKHEETRAAALEELRQVEAREVAETQRLARADADASGARKLSTAQLEERIRHWERLGKIEQAYADVQDGRLQQLATMVEADRDRATALAGLAVMEAALTRRLREQIAAGRDATEAWKRLQEVRQARGGFELGDDGVTVQPEGTNARQTREASRAAGGGLTADERARHSAAERIGVPLPGTGPGLPGADGRFGLPDDQELARQIRVEYDLTVKGLPNVNNAFRRIAQSMRGGRTEAEHLHDTIDSLTTGAVQGFATAIQSTFAAMISGSQSAGAAFAQAMVGMIATSAQVIGDYYIAKGTAAVGEGIAGDAKQAAAAPHFFTAAALFYALSGVAQGVAGAIGGGGGGGRGSGSLDAVGRDKDLSKADRGAATVIWEGESFDPRDPKQLQKFGKVMEQVGNRRMIMKVRGQRVRVGGKGGI